jgi:L-aminopeptidase/D-esterase-like protein
MTWPDQTSPSIQPRIAPGPRNLITDVQGIRVGNAEDDRVRTGTTVVVPETPCPAGVNVAGGAPGTRDTDALDPTCHVRRVDAIVLSGGSAFGLGAADGVMDWLALRGRGFAVANRFVPIVPSAILFDLNSGGDKDWGSENPYRGLGARAIAATEAGGLDFALGNVGCGMGASAGRLKGGLGSASAVTEDGLQVGAIVGVNAFGSTVMPGSATFWAWYLEQAGEMGGQPAPTAPVGLQPESKYPLVYGANTTIAVVATNARLDKADCERVALMAQDGMARAIRPAHTPFDGDTVFCLATGAVDLPGDRAGLYRVGALAADCLARAIARGVYHAESAGGRPSYRELHGAALRGARR